MTTTDKGVPLDFVYAGQRAIKGDARAVCIAVIQPDGSLKERFYAYTRKMERTIGCVYHGATFSPDSSYGVPSAKWVRRWEDEGDHIRWAAEEVAALAKFRLKKLEGEAGRTTEIEKILLPLRREYAKASARYDYSLQQALEMAVLSALRARPRSTE